MLIREAGETDIPEILELLRGMDGEEPPNLSEALAIWRKMQKYPYYKVFVAEEEKLLGVCSLIIMENWGHGGSKFAVAENVVVAPEQRGQGVGARLMQFVRDRAGEEKCYKLMLSSNKKRIAAHRFYERLGFEQHGISYAIEASNFNEVKRND